MSLSVPPPAIPLRRKLLFACLASILATVSLGVSAEVLLRAFGFGHSPRFARRETLPDGSRIWRENRWCTAPFFTADLVRRPQPLHLPERKAAKTYRIFVLGSSAAMGDPEPSFSIARMLDVLLHAAHPDVRFEVVNAGITAINSHVVRGIADDCARLEPDLFIVYEGNNEIIGPFGPAGVFSSFYRSPLLLRAAVAVKGTRTAQAISAAVRKASGIAPEREWRGMQMFLDQQIGADDPRLESVRRHFAANLRDVSAAAAAAGARTLLCTVVTNQRDFAPFLSRHRSDLSEADLRRWESHLTNGIAAERSRDVATAEREYRAALALDDQHAELVFRLGRICLQAGRGEEARALLQRATDLDALRFRTDSRLNAVIREVAASAPATQLVDLARELAAGSAHEIVGDELVYEHVHLTFRGTYDAACRLVPAISSDLERRGLSPAARPLPSLDQTRQALAFTAYEQGMIAVELVKRFSAAPFTGQIDHAIRLQSWQQRVDAANRLLNRPGATEALRTLYHTALRARPDDWVLQRNAGAMLVARGQPADAEPLLQRALTTIPDDADTLAALALAQQALGRDGEAAATFDRLRALEPRHPLLP